MFPIEIVLQKRVIFHRFAKNLGQPNKKRPNGLPTGFVICKTYQVASYFKALAILKRNFKLDFR